MNLHTWWLFVATVFVISAIPGPNMLLVMTHGARHGLRRSSATMAGCLTALVLMLSVSAAGLGVFLQAWPAMFDTLRFAGAAYLVWLGLKSWRAKVADAKAEPDDVAEDGQRRRPLAVRAVPQRLPDREQQPEVDPVRHRAAAAVHRRQPPDAAAVRRARVDIRRDRSELVSALRGPRHADRHEAEKRERRESVQPADRRAVRRLRRDDGAGATLILAVAVGVAARRANGGRRTVHRAGARLAPDWGVSFAFEHTFAGAARKVGFERSLASIEEEQQ